MQAVIMDKREFLKNGEYAKEEYEGIIVSSDTKHGYYNIAIELDNNRVVIVDNVKDNEVHQRLHQWVPKVLEVQKQFGVHNQADNYYH